jgi:hypothetical protein
MRRYLLFLFLLLLFLTPFCHGQVANQLVTIGANGKYLYNSITGKPMFLVGEDVFDLSTQVNQASVQQYFQDRASRGYNAVWMAVIDQGDQNNKPNDYYGNGPFNGQTWFSANENSGTGPAYWANQDWVIQQAAKLNIIVLLHVSFFGSSSEPYDLASALAASDATMTAYGTFLGNRYRGYNNIIYVLGGDTDPSASGVTAKLNDIANGILAADTNHLITMEGCRGTCRFGSQKNSIQSFGGRPPSWIKLNWTYTHQADAVTSCQASYSSSPWLPPLLGEDDYETTPLGPSGGLTALQYREQGYWEILSGCYLGRVIGNAAIWSLNSVPAGANHWTPWLTELSSGQSVAEEFIGLLFRQRKHWLLVPDISHTYLTGGYNFGAALSVLARTSDGQTMIAYIPNGGAATVTVNMAGIVSSTSTVNEWWYNPRTGVATHIGMHANSGSRAFTPPDSNDWVLVLDDNSAGLAGPGAGGKRRRK